MFYEGPYGTIKRALSLLNAGFVSERVTRVSARSTFLKRERESAAILIFGSRRVRMLGIWKNNYRPGQKKEKESESSVVPAAAIQRARASLLGRRFLYGEDFLRPSKNY